MAIRAHIVDRRTAPRAIAIARPVEPAITPEVLILVVFTLLLSGAAWMLGT